MAKKISTSPTQRTLKWCRDQGWTADVCERWISFGGKGGIRKDLFGVFDVIAVTDFPGVLGIQCTSASNAAARVAKLGVSYELGLWLVRDNWCEVHGWRQKPNRRWVVNRWSLNFDGGKIVETRIDDA